MLLNGTAHTFTIPLRGASSNLKICDIELAEEPRWRAKLLMTVRQAYVKAPCFDEVFGLIIRIVNFPSKRLDEFLLNSLNEITNFLELDVNIIESSRRYGNASLKGQSRILDICKREDATRYINPIGGLDLYNKVTFAHQGVELSFLKPCPDEYFQYKEKYVPNLSILDVLMFNRVQAVRQLLYQNDIE
jgi:hypothetical protein